MLDQVADALAAAHALGIVHRDIKPSNVMLVDEPGGELVVKVTDFGVAKSLRSDLALDRPRETAVGELIGSPEFMSPEQIIGDSAVGPSSDVWSLGVVTYEAVTGGACFEGANVPQLMMSIGKGIYRPASQVRPELPRGIDAFFARALAARPQNRFASATELAEAFRALIVQPRKSNRGVVITGIAMITAIACVGLFALLRTLDGVAPAPVEAPSGALIIAPPHHVPTVTVAPPSPRDTPTSSPSSTPRVTTTSRVKTTASAAPSVPVIAPAVTAEPAPIPPPPAPPHPKKRIDPSEIQ